jgi:hypothetical protein
MTVESPRDERPAITFGAVAAIAGTLFQVAAGSSQTAAIEAGVDEAVPALAEQAAWVWPVISFGFMFGALLWVLALVVLASTMRGRARAWGRLAVAAVIVGAAIHIVDAALNAGPLAALARDWSGADDAQRVVLTQNADLLLRVLDGTWAGAITLFHGIPFVLVGTAVIADPDHPSWLGWLSVLGGTGSVAIGILMFLGLVGPGPAVPFAVVLSIFMVIVGGRMWSEAG